MLSKKILSVDRVFKPHFVWFEDNWVHDNVLHKHSKAQLIYVESGFQYLTVNAKVYLLPQKHAAWIPPNALHKTNSHAEKTKLMVMFFDVNKEDLFYHEVSVFSVSAVLKEMIKYAEKWSKNTAEDLNENIFLSALYNELPNFVADAIQLHISLPEDKRLTNAIKHLNNNYTKAIRVEELSEITSLSLRSIERIFKKETGLTLSKYQQMLRIIKSLELLSTKRWTVSEIAYKVGYKSLQAYTNSFRSVMQYRPTDFLKSI